jgi:hypothetical protein
VKLARSVGLSGELYRGRAIGGLGGGVGDTVLKSGSLGLFGSAVLPVDSAGGWAQLKYKPLARWEFNMAFGGDLPYSPHGSSVALFVSDHALAPKRNKSAFWNVIYQPRNNLLLSVEYRKLWTAPFQEALRRASYAGVGAGVLF